MGSSGSGAVPVAFPPVARLSIAVSCPGVVARASIQKELYIAWVCLRVHRKLVPAACHGRKKPHVTA